MNQKPDKNLLSALLSASRDASPVGGVEAWWERHRARAASFDEPWARAAYAGFFMDRLGYAFASGYREALGALDPTMPEETKVALAVTEAGGGHPRAIATTLTETPDGFVLDGEKTYVSLGVHADEMLVAARRGAWPDGRPHISVVRVPRDRLGVLLTPLPDLPFVPEIPHAKATFEGVTIAASDIRFDDGYEDCVKPFRTVEDTHVFAAFLGYAIGFTRRLGDDDARLEEMAMLLSSLGCIAAHPRLSTTHVILAGIVRSAARLAKDLADACAKAGPADEEAVRFLRDLPLLSVASSVRERRRQTAWATFRA